jgi:hypothetical protein
MPRTGGWQRAQTCVCLPPCAEVANLQSWLLAHVAWMDGALDKAAAAPAVQAASSP